jgi:hypothetical protein
MLSIDEIFGDNSKPFESEVNIVVIGTLDCLVTHSHLA